MTRARRRGQTGLPALAVALLVLTVVTGLGLAVADGALAGSQRDAGERRLAVSLADRLVGTDSPLTVRANVLDGSRVDGFDATQLRSTYPAAEEGEVRVSVGERVVAATGDASGGTTVRRLVVIERRESREVTPALGWNRSVTLPRRASRATLALSPRNATVETVRANERVLLHDPDGLNGTYDVSLSRRETTQFRFDAEGRLREGNVTIEYEPVKTTRATLAVTADA